MVSYYARGPVSYTHLICVYPAQHLTQDEIDTMVDYTGRFARELHVTGLVNVQYAVSHGRVYVIEVNPRLSLIHI